MVIYKDVFLNGLAPLKNVRAGVYHSTGHFIGRPSRHWFGVQVMQGLKVLTFTVLTDNFHSTLCCLMVAITSPATIVDLNPGCLLLLYELSNILALIQIVQIVVAVRAIELSVLLELISFC